jgi:hypothetical protein
MWDTRMEEGEVRRCTAEGNPFGGRYFVLRGSGEVSIW